MSNPFDYVKSVTKSKEDLYTTEELFNKEYVPYIINKSLSNSPNYAPFAEVIDKYGTVLDKKLQYDFYLHGIPKSTRYEQLWTKKDSGGSLDDEIEYVSHQLNISLKRARQTIQLIGLDNVRQIMSARGGRMK